MSCGRTQDKLDQLLKECYDGNTRNSLYNEHFYEGSSAPRFLFVISYLLLGPYVCYFRKEFLYAENQTTTRCDFESFVDFAPFLEWKGPRQFTYCKACLDKGDREKAIADHPAAGHSRKTIWDYVSEVKSVFLSISLYISLSAFLLLCVVIPLVRLSPISL